MASETPYVETEALLAVMNEDEERLGELLDGMFPGELDDLAITASALLTAASRVAREKRSLPATGETPAEALLRAIFTDQAETENPRE